MPDELEDRLGEMRFSAWLAISRVQRKVMYDQLQEEISSAVANKSDASGVLVAAKGLEFWYGLF